MYLQKLNLINFKNYPEAELSFSEGINCLAGQNGGGKTNLLDAIHYLSLCKSYFNAADSQNILTDAPFFVIQGTFELQNEITIYCGVKRGQKKQFKINNKEYEKLADHIGLLPLVMIAPIDILLIIEGSEERRRLIDGIISQYDKEYLDSLINYNKILSQRNSYLKQLSQQKNIDKAMLEVYDEQLIPLASIIFKKRKDFLDEFIPVFKNYYSYIADNSEEVGISYESQLTERSMDALLHEMLNKDLALQYTSVGIHKDDLDFTIKGMSVKKFASQGQQKSFLIALKLAQFEFIKKIKNLKPLLLLDDIFDKLDEQRVSKLLRLVANGEFGQVFITDTNENRIWEMFNDIDVPIKMFEVKDGIVNTSN
jgi:DNA replication and repair protein RecF